jgi:hypothetical protein
MFSYQMAIMIVLCLLCVNKASFWGAFTLLVAYCIYAPLVIPMPAIYYYSCASSLALFVGIILHKRHKVAAICAYSLPLVNILGFFLWVNYYTPGLYDNISAVILIIQVISLLPKRLLNGFRFYRYNHQHSLVKSSGFNGD